MREEFETKVTGYEKQIAELKEKIGFNTDFESAISKSKATAKELLEERNVRIKYEEQLKALKEENECLQSKVQSYVEKSSADETLKELRLLKESNEAYRALFEAGSGSSEGSSSVVVDERTRNLVTCLESRCKYHELKSLASNAKAQSCADEARRLRNENESLKKKVDETFTSQKMNIIISESNQRLRIDNERLEHDLKSEKSKYVALEAQLKKNVLALQQLQAQLQHQQKQQPQSKVAPPSPVNPQVKTITQRTANTNTLANLKCQPKQQPQLQPQQQIPAQVTRKAVPQPQPQPQQAGAPQRPVPLQQKQSVQLNVFQKQQQPQPQPQVTLKVVQQPPHLSTQQQATQQQNHIVPAEKQQLTQKVQPVPVRQIVHPQQVPTPVPRAPVQQPQPQQQHLQAAQLTPAHPQLQQSPTPAQTTHSQAHQTTPQALVPTQVQQQQQQQQQPQTVPIVPVQQPQTVLPVPAQLQPTFSYSQDAFGNTQLKRPHDNGDYSDAVHDGAGSLSGVNIASAAEEKRVKIDVAEEQQQQNTETVPAESQEQKQEEQPSVSVEGPVEPMLEYSQQQQMQTQEQEQDQEQQGKTTQI